MAKIEKVYAAEFMTYTNCLRNTVSNYKEGDPIESVKYLNVGVGTFLVKESDIDKYRKFGDGYKSLMFVGNIEVDN